MLKTLTLTLALALAGTAAKAADIVISDPWSRATAGAGRVGAVYLTLANHGSETDRLVAATTPVADRVELHTHLHENGVMRMRQVQAVEIAPGEPTLLQPGGLHIMLFDLKDRLQEGDSHPITLIFEQAGSLTVDFLVGAAGATTAPRNGQAAPHDHPPVGDHSDH